MAAGEANFGGLLPSDACRAEDRAEVPGPGSEACGSARPGRGVCMGTGETSSSWAGVGIWPTAGVRDCTEEGTGEPSLAVDSALGIDCEMDGERELWPECLDDEGTACGFDDSGESFAMTATIFASVACWRASTRLSSSRRLSVCNVGDSALRG